MRVLRFWKLLPGVVLALLIAGCAGEATAPDVAFRNVTGAVTYVGDAACASCHEDDYTGYRAHGMARSFYPLTEENRVEPLPGEPLVHAATGYTYTVVEGAGGLYQEEVLRSESGEVIHRLRRRMDYVMGSGNAARTYFAESNGRLYELPLTWYTQAQRWAFSPGYEVRNARFDRLIPNRCMACHNGYPEPVPFVEGTFTAVPEGITCERCHGPGALHVEERLATPEPAGEIDSTIVNPAHLPFDRRLDVCQQCHLQTTVSVLREGRTAFDFMPSEALSDHVALFVAHEPSGDAIDVVSHADRMRQSACFVEARSTARPLECTTCHDPHEGFRDKGPAYFNQTCLTCHDAQALQTDLPAAARADHTPDADCFACHMPKVAAEDAPHASFTDHWIRVVGRTPEPEDEAEHEVLEPYFTRDAGNQTGQRYLGEAVVVLGRQRNDAQLMATGAATLDAALRADTTHGAAYFLLGVTHRQLGNLDRALPALERAVRIDPNQPEWLDALAQAYADAGRDPAVIDRLYRRALAIQPALARVRVHYGRFLHAQGRYDEAIAAFVAAHAGQPWLDEAALGLGLVWLSMGGQAKAEEAFAEALHLDPSHAEALAEVLVVTTDAAGDVWATDVVTPVQHPLVEAARDEEAVRVVPAEAPGAVRIMGLPPRAAVRIYTADGVLVRSLEKTEAPPALAWDLRTDAGRLLDSGVHLIHVRALDAAGRTTWTRVQKWAVVYRRTDGGEGA